MSPDPTLAAVVVVGVAAFVADVYLLGVRPAARDAIKDAEKFQVKHLAACQTVLKGANLDLLQEINADPTVATLFEKPSAGVQPAAPPRERIEAATGALDAILGRYRTGAHVHDSLKEIKSRGERLSALISQGWILALAGVFLGVSSAVAWLYGLLMPGQLGGVVSFVLIVLGFLIGSQWWELDSVQQKARGDLEKELENRFYFAGSTVKPDLANPPQGPST